MSGRNLHIIQKQYLKLNLEEENDAFGQQTAIRSAYYEKVLPAFEAVLDRFSREGVTIRLDKIHLELGDLDWDEVDGRFAEVAAQALSEQLSLLIPKGEMKRVEGVEILPRAESEMGILVRFLKTGTLPWWSGKEPMDPREIFFEALEKRPQALVGELIKSFPGTDMVRRLARQFSTQSVQKLFSVMETPVSGPALRLLDALLELVQKPSTSFSWQTSQVKETLLERIFAEAAGAKKAMAVTGSSAGKVWKEIGPELIRALAAKTGRPAAVLVAELRKALKIAGTTAVSKRTLKAFVEAISEVSGHQKSTPSPKEELPESRTEPESESGFTPKKKSSVPDPSEPSKGQPWRVEDGEEFYIENAGLVLAGGFLEFLFQNLGYLDGKQFRDLESRERAVYVLEYLVRGEGPADPPEEELFLNKILCGFPLDEVLSPLSYPLTAQETSEVENLLKAMIGYWKELGSITPDDLRKAFLLREGKMCLKNSDWELKVDRQTVDVLLESIPWTVGMIEHGWMSNAVVVDW